MNDDDSELMKEIERQADRAAEAAPKRFDSLALSIELAKRFPHRSQDEIRQKLREHWQAKGLFFAD